MKFRINLFQDSVLLKGLDGLLEIVGGVLILVVNPAMLNRWVVSLTEHELAADPHDYIANKLLHAAHGFTGQSAVYASAYLLGHGIIKIILVVGLLRRERWAYPATMGFLVLFIVYQLYQIMATASISMTLLTIFDALVLWLVWREYRRLSLTDSWDTGH